MKCPSFLLRDDGKSHSVHKTYFQGYHKRLYSSLVLLVSNHPSVFVPYDVKTDKVNIGCLFFYVRIITKNNSLWLMYFSLWLPPFFTWWRWCLEGFKFSRSRYVVRSLIINLLYTEGVYNFDHHKRVMSSEFISLIKVSSKVNIWWVLDDSEIREQYCFFFDRKLIEVECL